MPAAQGSGHLQACPSPPPLHTAQAKISSPPSASSLFILPPNVGYWAVGALPFLPYKRCFSVP